jgi:hypothetical protein
LSDSRRRSSSIGVGLGVIFIGAVLLLGPLDLLDSGFWGNLLAMWPVLMIAAGTNLVLRRA